MNSAFLVIIVCGVIAIGASKVLRARRVTAEDLVWIGGSEDIPASEVEVYTNYLRRYRLSRVIGATLGITGATIIGFRWFDTVWVGLSPLPMSNVLVSGVLGCIAGALFAESFTLRRRSDGIPSAASLSLRPATPRHRALSAAWIVVAIAMVVGTVLISFGVQWFAPATSALTGVVMVSLAALTSRAITSRARPVLSARAAVVDDRLRAFGRERVARLALAAAVLALACTLTSIGTAMFPEQTAFTPDTLAPNDALIEGALIVILFTGLVIALVLLHRARPYPPRSFASPSLAHGGDAGVGTPTPGEAAFFGRAPENAASP